MTQAEFCIVDAFSNGKEYELWVCYPHEEETDMEDDLEFAICLQQDGWEAWDNNHGMNYKYDGPYHTYEIEYMEPEMYLIPWERR